ncbi:putative RNA methyltransferase bin3, bin3-type S-adenosyl-L-methionine binding protein [Helianthus debilis subsp. tardiflorus]
MCGRECFSSFSKRVDFSLSVSKWIHLNWGDEGLITLFSKVWRLLKPGGIFILEPQPWKSYVSNRQVSEVYSSIGFIH